MKWFAIILCFYFNALTILPSVKAIKIHFFQHEQQSCSNSCSDDSSGCNKEKCLLNYSLNSSSFIVYHSNFSFLNIIAFVTKKENIKYHKNFKANYNSTIWHPPELLLFS